MEQTQPYMETTAAPDWRATADEIWAMMRENTQKYAEVRELLDKVGRDLDKVGQKQEETAKQMQKTDRQMQETENAKLMRENDEIIKENYRMLEKLGGNRFGEVDDHLIVPNLVKKFRKLQFDFTKAGLDFTIKDSTHDIFLEVDAFLENGDKVMIVEIKTKPSIGDIDDHVRRMEKLRVYADLHNDKRKYYGSIGGVVFGESEKIYALKNGFYVIEPSGDSFNITAPQGSCQPQEW